MGMGMEEQSSGHHHHHAIRHHHALDEVVNLLSKANHDLSLVHHHLDKEFRSSYPDNANPFKIAARVKKMQEDLAELQDMCCELLAGKQDLIEKASAALLGQKSLLQRLLASCGLPPVSYSDNLVYTNLDEVIDEWKAHVGTKTEENRGVSVDINNLLFSSIVHNA